MCSCVCVCVCVCVLVCFSFSCLATKVYNMPVSSAAGAVCVFVRLFVVFNQSLYANCEMGGSSLMIKRELWATK